MTFSLGKCKDLIKNRTVRIIAVCVLALLLLLAAYRVFVGGKSEKKSAGYTPTAQEERLLTLLTGIEGVRNATVMITEAEGVAVGVVIIFDGDDGFLTRMRITDVAATALNIERTSVVVYPAEA